MTTFIPFFVFALFIVVEPSRTHAFRLDLLRKAQEGEDAWPESYSHISITLLVHYSPVASNW